MFIDIWQGAKYASTTAKKLSKCRVFWSVFFHIWTDWWDIRNEYPYSVQRRENEGQKNSVFAHFSRSVRCNKFTWGVESYDNFE